MTRYVKPFTTKIQLQGKIRIPIRVRDVLGIIPHSLVYISIKKGPLIEWIYFSGRVDSEGRLTIPKKIRTSHTLKFNEIYDYEVELAPKEVDLASKKVKPNSKYPRIPLSNSYLRICRDCNLIAYTEKDLEDFQTADSRYKHGKLNLCISCFKKRKKRRNKIYALTHPDKIKQYYQDRCAQVKEVDLNG